MFAKVFGCTILWVCSGLAESPASDRGNSVSQEKSNYAQYLSLFLDNAMSRMFNNRIYYDSLFQKSLAQRRAAGVPASEQGPYLQQAAQMQGLADSIASNCDLYLYKQKRATILVNIYSSSLYQLAKTQTDSLLSVAESSVASATSILESTFNNLCQANGITDTSFITATHQTSQGCMGTCEALRNTIAALVASVADSDVAAILAQS